MTLALLRMQSPCCNLHKNRFVQKIIKNGLENISIRACSSKTKVGGIYIYIVFRMTFLVPEIRTFLRVILLCVTV